MTNRIRTLIHLFLSFQVALAADTPADTEAPKPDPVVVELNAAKARFEAETNLINAQKARLTAEKLAAQELVPAIPAIGKAGDVTLNGAAPVEGVALSYRVLSALAKEMAGGIRCEDKERLVILTPADLAGVESFLAWSDQTKLLAGRIDEVLAENNRLRAFEDMEEALKAGAGSFAPAALAVVGPAIQSLVNLINLFRTDTTITVADTTVDEKALVAVLGAQVRQKKPGCKVYYTSGVQPGLALDPNPVMEKLEALHAAKGQLLDPKVERRRNKALAEGKRDAEKATLDDLDAKVAALPDLRKQAEATEKALAGEKDPVKKKELDEKLVALRAKIKNAEDITPQVRADQNTVYLRWKQYVDESTQLLTAMGLAEAAVDAVDASLTRLDENAGATRLVALRRGALLKKWFEKPVYLLRPSVQKLAANTRTRKNLFLGTRVSFAGGAVASFEEYKMDSTEEAGELVASNSCESFTPYVGQQNGSTASTVSSVTVHCSAEVTAVSSTTPAQPAAGGGK